MVSSTLGFGPLITSFDPVLTGTLQEDHFSQPATSIFQGVPDRLAQNTGTVNFAYQQGFQWGTNLRWASTTPASRPTASFNTLSPPLNSNFKFKLTQHLLQGFGFAANTRFIRIAKNNRELSDVAFRLQIITTVDQIENMYWDLVYAYENARVQNESLAFAQKTLSDTKKQVEIGSLAPIEVVRAQSTVAQDQQARDRRANQSAVGAVADEERAQPHPEDPMLATAEVIPTSTMEVPAEEQVVPTEDLINDALRHRAELVESRIDLNSRELSNKAVRSALLAHARSVRLLRRIGLGGVAESTANLCAQPAIQRQFGFCAAPPERSQVTSTSSPSSYGGTLNQLVNSTAPDKGVGLQLNIPLRNRAAQAVQIRSELEYRQAQMRLQQIENQVSIEVRNAQFAVEQNRASVDSAKAAVD